MQCQRTAGVITADWVLSYIIDRQDSADMEVIPALNQKHVSFYIMHLIHLSTARGRQRYDLCIGKLDQKKRLVI